jgi:uncharacterized protein YbcI
MPVPEEAPPNGRLRVAISNALSQVVVDYTGRGPERARTSIAEDTVVCLLSGTLNRAERRLAATGKGELVLEIRRSYQEAMRDDFVGAVSGITGREVVAFMSDNHLDPDLAVEVFVLDASAQG